MRPPQAWIRSLIARLGSTRAAIIVEPDAVPADCFDDPRARLMAQAVRQLSDAGQSVYIDAGPAAASFDEDFLRGFLDRYAADSDPDKRLDFLSYHQ